MAGTRWPRRQTAGRPIGSDRGAPTDRAARSTAIGVRLRGMAARRTSTTSWPATTTRSPSGSCRRLPRAVHPRSTAERFVREPGTAAFAEGGAAYAIADPETDRLLGGSASTGSSRPAPGRDRYWVVPWARGRGVATAAVRALSRHAFAHRHGAARTADPLGEHGQPAGRAGGRLPARGRTPAALPDRDGGRDDLLVFARLAGDPPGRPPRLLPDLPGGELTDGVVTLRPLARPTWTSYAELHGLPDVMATSVPPSRPTHDRGPPALHPRGRALARRHRADLVIVDAATGTPAGEIGLFYQEPATGAGDDRLQHAAGVAGARLRRPAPPSCCRCGRSPRPASPA